jgi:hypothetical protein
MKQTNGVIPRQGVCRPKRPSTGSEVLSASARSCAAHLGWLPIRRLQEIIADGLRQQVCLNDRGVTVVDREFL